MFGIGFLELVLIAVVALVVLGPQKLPGLMQQLGRYFLQLRRISAEVRESLDHVLHEAQADLEVEADKKSQAKSSTLAAQQDSRTMSPPSPAADKTP